MSLPLKYSLLSPKRRKLSTSLTVAGIALVAILFVVVSGLAQGLTYVFASTGRPDNLVILRAGTSSIAMSRLTEETVEALRYAPELARDADGRPLLSPEVFESLYLLRDSGVRMPVAVRGVDPVAFRVHDEVTVVEGRLPAPLSREMLVGTALARRSGGLAVGQTVSVGGQEWGIVGRFEADGNLFESELWADRRTLLGLRMRNGANYTVARIAGGDEETVAAAEARLEADPSLAVRAGVESLYYLRGNYDAAETVRLIRFILVVVMGFAMAVTGMNTLYGLIAARSRELGTLRVLGFRPRDLLQSVLLEAAAIGFVGGLLGGLLSLAVRGVPVIYNGVQLNFRIGPELIAQGLILSTVIGVLGGLLPALRAARMEVVETLRSL